MVVIIILKIGIGLYRIEWLRKNIWDFCILSFYSIKFDILFKYLDIYVYYM